MNLNKLVTKIKNTKTSNKFQQAINEYAITCLEATNTIDDLDDNGDKMIIGVMEQSTHTVNSKKVRAIEKMLLLR